MTRSLCVCLRTGLRNAVSTVLQFLLLLGWAPSQRNRGALAVGGWLSFLLGAVSRCADRSTFVLSSSLDCRSGITRPPTCLPAGRSPHRSLINIGKPLSERFYAIWGLLFFHRFQIVRASSSPFLDCVWLQGDHVDTARCGEYRFYICERVVDPGAVEQVSRRGRR